MTISIYNVTNHGLRAEQLRKLNDFSTDDYCGVIGKSTSPAFSGTGSVTVNTDIVSDGCVWLLGGGCLVSVTKKEIEDLVLQASKYYYISVTLPTFDVDNPSADTSAYAELVVGIGSDAYTGVTVWESDIKFRIPLFSTDANDAVSSIVYIKSKSQLEEWLSTRAYMALWDTLHSTFTHQSGSSGSVVKDSSGNITSVSSDKRGKVADVDFLSILNSETNEYDTVVCKWTGGVLQAYYTLTSGGQIQSHYFDNGAMIVSPGITGYREILTVPALPVSYGGTGGTSKSTARSGLGIYYGTSDPESAVANPETGDIYFKILT